MELRENLLLAEVVYENNGKKAVLNFIDEERGELRQVTFNLQKYEDGKFIDDPQKAEQVAEWCKEYFDTTFDRLAEKVGITKDVYCYDRFNSLWEAQTVSKFTEDLNGQMIFTKVKEIVVDDIAIRIRYDYEGNTYETKMTYADYIENMKRWFKNPVKRQKVYDRFKEKFGVDVEHKDELIGHDLIVEVRSAFGKNFWGDIKPFPKKK